MLSDWLFLFGGLELDYFVGTNKDEELFKAKNYNRILIQTP